MSRRDYEDCRGDYIRDMRIDDAAMGLHRLDACQSAYDRADDSGPALTCEWCERRHHTVTTQPYARRGLVFHVRACEDCYGDWLTANRAELEEAQTP